MQQPADSYWTKGYWRTKALFAFLRAPMRLYFRIANNFRCTPYKPKNPTFLLLTNHNSTVDHFLNCIGIRGVVRFVVSDHLLRKGFASKVLKFLVNPIPRRKGSSAEPTVKMIQQNLRLGMPVIMYAEGNRSFNGRTGFISPRTGELVKNAEGSLITYRIDGAYMQTPRWGISRRHGPVFGSVVREYSREELNQMSAEEIYAHIKEDLSCDAYAYQKQHNYRYKAKNKAEKLETTLFVCPKCESLGTLRSEGDRFFCSCGMSVSVNDYGFFEGADARFESVYDWDMWQRGVLKARADELRGKDELFTQDKGMTLYLVNGDEKQKLGSQMDMRLYGDRLDFVGDTTVSFPIGDITGTAVAHTLFLYFSANGKYYEVHSSCGPWAANKYFALHRMLNQMNYV